MTLRRLTLWGHLFPYLREHQLVLKELRHCSLGTSGRAHWTSFLHVRRVVVRRSLLDRNRHIFFDLFLLYVLWVILVKDILFVRRLLLLQFLSVYVEPIQYLKVFQVHDHLLYVFFCIQIYVERAQVRELRENRKYSLSHTLLPLIVNYPRDWVTPDWRASWMKQAVRSDYSLRDQATRSDALTILRFFILRRVGMIVARLIRFLLMRES